MTFLFWCIIIIIIIMCSEEKKVFPSLINSFAPPKQNHATHSRMIDYFLRYNKSSCNNFFKSPKKSDIPNIMLLQYQKDDHIQYAIKCVM